MVAWLPSAWSQFGGAFLPWVSFVCPSVFVAHLECPSHSQQPSLCRRSFTKKSAGGRPLSTRLRAPYRSRLQVGLEALGNPRGWPWPQGRREAETEGNTCGHTVPSPRAQPVLPSSPGILGSPSVTCDIQGVPFSLGLGPMRSHSRGAGWSAQGRKAPLCRPSQR